MRSCNVVVDVFSDSNFEDKIDSYEMFSTIEAIEYDLLDGDDWWQEIVDIANEKFGSNWRKIFVHAVDGDGARVLDKDYCETGKSEGRDFVFHDKIFLIGETTSENLASCFSGSISLSYPFADNGLAKFYHKGRDEGIILLLKSLLLPHCQGIKVVDVVYNPSPQSVLAMKLRGHYKYMVHFSTKEKLNELIGFERLVRYAIDLQGELRVVRAIGRRYHAERLNFMLPFVDEIEAKLDLDSQGSFLDLFERHFCV